MNPVPGAPTPGPPTPGPPAAVLAGLGAYVPPRVVTNEELTRELDTSDQWIFSRTGIRQRHVVEPGTATADLAAEAGARALKSAEASAVDAVVLATATPDRPCPATAPDVAARLGLGGIAAFDVAAVCSGFVYGLWVAAGAIATGAERVLLIAADTFSTITDPADRATRVIFGDGAGAVVLRRGTAGEPGALGPIDLGSDGTQAELIMIPGGGSLRPAGTPDGQASPYFTMRGRTVFRIAVERMTASSRTVLARAGWSADDVDLLVAHQANARITEALGERLGIAAACRASNIAKVGNTASASIPLALADAAAQGTLRPGHRVLMTAFGGGAAWGSAALVWPDLAGH
ncbi:3-oxoacyl-[acyl-carrier-protein] synthase-3 [Catenulispora sp. MAP12-49]|uniref:beta-ketoacyl-ACP synthase III n=1 Tax=Catenulispora sp. MAP12-49 TaxID=3156302 RepID=UPI0035114DF5